jgi:hypothetical protein
MHGGMNQDDQVTTVGPNPTLEIPGVRWGAIFAGMLVAAGAWMLLHMLGMAIGLVSLDVDNLHSLRGVGIGVGVWSLLVPLIALFLGGLATGRLARPLSGASGVIHGAVVWSLATIASVALLWVTLSAIVGGVLAAGTTIASTTVTVGAIGATSDITAESLGLAPDEILAPVNRRLNAEGLPPVTSDQLMAAARDALRTAVKQGRLDRQVVTGALARHTALTPDEITQVAGTIEQSYEKRTAELADAARARAEELADATGKAMFGLFLATLLGLAAAAAGTALGARVPGTSTRRSVRSYSGDYR